jgi:hypothetical protein
MWGWDGMSPFKDKKAVSFWPLIFINMLLPESMRYDPRNIIILYIATSATSGQPKNFEPHLSVVTDELILAANGFDLQVRGETVRVHLVAPIFTADARGDPPPPPHTHTHTNHKVIPALLAFPRQAERRSPTALLAVPQRLAVATVRLWLTGASLLCCYIWSQLSPVTGT